MPSRTRAQAAAKRIFDRWPAAQRASIDALELVYRVLLRPFRRTRLAGRARESAAIAAGTDAYNEAAERYFARFPDPEFLLGKPFSDPALSKHLIDAGVLIDAMRLTPRDVVVELGAGSCWLSHMLNRFGCRTLSVDVSSTALALGRTLFERDPRTNWNLNPEFRVYDGRRLPLEDASCDRIVINDAFHHIPNQRELLSEMHRVLRRDGLVAMSEPGIGHGITEQSVAEGESGVLENELVLEDLAALAGEAGFRDVTVVVASPLVRHQIPARDLGPFMGGKGFVEYWKSLCSGLEQHHFIVLHKESAAATTRHPGRLTARIEIVSEQPYVLRITNLGDTRWLAREGDGWTRLGAHLYRSGPPREPIDFDWLRVSLPHDVNPGDRVTASVPLPALPGPGDYLVVFDLVVEGLAWFADRGSTPATRRIRVP